jgi:hypothetical protein
VEHVAEEADAFERHLPLRDRPQDRRDLRILSATSPTAQNSPRWAPMTSLCALGFLPVVSIARRWWTWSVDFDLIERSSSPHTPSDACTRWPSGPSCRRVLNALPRDPRLEWAGPVRIRLGPPYTGPFLFFLVKLFLLIRFYLLDSKIHQIFSDYANWVIQIPVSPSWCALYRKFAWLNVWSL